MIQYKSVNLKPDVYEAIRAEQRRGETFEGTLVRLLDNKIKLLEERQ
jgi:hypothetical protein